MLMYWLSQNCESEIVRVAKEWNNSQIVNLVDLDAAFIIAGMYRLKLGIEHADAQLLRFIVVGKPTLTSTQFANQIGMVELTCLLTFIFAFKFKTEKHKYFLVVIIKQNVYGIR